MMTITASRLIPIALVAALVGGTAGAYISHSYTNNNAGLTTGSTSQSNDGTVSPVANTSTDPAIQPTQESTLQNTDQTNPTVTESNTASSNSTATSTKSIAKSDHYSRSRVAYAENTQPRNRTFWDKHRDKLTVAMGSGGGALIGGLLGGRRGAGIGLLAGGGGSAYYTYKARKRHPQY